MVEQSSRTDAGSIRGDAVPRERLIPAGSAFLRAVLLAGAVLVAAACRSANGAIDLRLPEAASATPSDGQMKVYVTGAVARPGVYAVHAGDRVADAIEVAGGPTDDADVLVVNFARRLRDEDHIVVPRRGEPLTTSAPGGQPNRRIDINSAPAATLETLPGIGPTRAKNIVDSRLRDGPFTDVADLVKRKLLPQSVFESIKDQIDIRP